MTEAHEPDHGRKTYYVSVGAGQVLKDKEAAPFELVIRLLHELGTEETKRHIESMNILHG